MAQIRQTEHGICTSTKELTEFKYRQSKIDPCIYYRESLLLAVYIDYCIITYKNKDLLRNLR